jgi:hypothetical protein
VQGSPSQVNGVGLRTLSRRRSWVRIPPPAPDVLFFLVVEEDSVFLVHHLPVGCLEWCVLVFGFVLGCLLVVGVSQVVQKQIQLDSATAVFVLGLLFFVSLCEKNCFNPLTCLLVGWALFCFLGVFLGLFGCVMRVFLHKPYMPPC